VSTSPRPRLVPLTDAELAQRVQGRLAGEVAIVTGSTAGLGRAIAKVLAFAGADVVVTGRTADKGADVVRGIEATGGRALYIRSDIADQRSCEELVAGTVEAFGGVSVLVNNASGRMDTRSHMRARITDMPAEDWLSVLVTDLASVATMCRLTIPHMVERGYGSIVNISSSTAERAVPKTSAYTAAKGGVNALTRAVTIEYAREGVRCNAVQPGYIVPEDEARRPKYSPDDRYLTRFTTGEDVALAVLFLAGREAETITGVVLQVDAGHTAVRALTI
jgi:NAD(P)-dependent dehydrogenase (short-subunit alcohol dehydrogenase family)